jgi:hypothetical protein
MKRSARNFMASVGIFTVASWASSAKAAPTTEELCEKLHADYLIKAQNALVEDKLEDALRFLLEAEAIAKRCADSSEGPLPQKQNYESGLASARYHSLV